MLIAQTSIAQIVNGYWTKKDEVDIKLIGERRIIPAAYSVYAIDSSILKSLIFAAPHEREFAVMESETFLSVPMPRGNTKRFRIVFYDMMEDGLAERYPEIKTGYGISAGNNPASIRFDWTYWGFHASILSDEGKIFIDPYSLGDTENYISYYKKDYPVPEEPFICHVTGKQLEEQIQSDLEKAGDCVFRSYRLAMATTAEYSIYHGATSSMQSGLVLSAVTTTMNRVNQVYERDATIRMILIANTDDVFYYDAATDPYTNNNGVTMLAENQTNIDAVIGTANYDIGHVFSTGGGGVATLESPCNALKKARGVTGLSSPEGDVFDIDFVAHEMGHQFGANHTQNNNCQRNDPTAMEPGSASTIMGYAGICSPNVQSNSDDYFHAVSLEEIAGFVTNSSSGDACDTPLAFSNGAPSVAAGLDYSIPVSTPFVLTATGSDIDGNPIIYCWEQFDNEIVSMPPSSTNTVGPMFRSFSPTAPTQRYFPRLQDIAANTSPIWEVLPSVARTMDFRVTMRDLNGTAGCTDEDDMTVTTDANSGPFLVTAPNTAVSFNEGQSTTVTWNVASTTAVPVSCANVDIFLSTDGGLTFPTTLASGVPNNGSANITFPMITSLSCRIIVKCSSSIFFDMSNENFELLSAGTSCVTYTNTTAVTIPSGMASTVTSTVNVSETENLQDVNVTDLMGIHTKVSHLTVSLFNPANTQVILFSGICGDTDDFNLKFDDSAASASIDCPPTTGLTYQPQGNLSSLNGAAINGTWILQIEDGVNGSGGELSSWAIRICYSSTALPIELVSFSAKPEGEYISLNWATASESNNAGFAIERSDEYNIEFNSIGWVVGSGNSRQNSRYSFYDHDVIPGIQYYYRLRQLDFDGRESFSDIKSAMIQSAENNFIIFPNPVKDVLYINCDGEIANRASLRLTNAQAGELMTGRLQDCDAEINMTTFPAGLYFLYIETPTKKWVEKVIKE